MTMKILHVIFLPAHVTNRKTGEQDNGRSISAQMFTPVFIPAFSPTRKMHEILAPSQQVQKTSAEPPKADMCSAVVHVRLSPKENPGTLPGASFRQRYGQGSMQRI